MFRAEKFHQEKNIRNWIRPMKLVVVVNKCVFEIWFAGCSSWERCSVNFSLWSSNSRASCCPGRYTAHRLVNPPWLSLSVLTVQRLDKHPGSFVCRLDGRLRGQLSCRLHNIPKQQSMVNFRNEARNRTVIFVRNIQHTGIFLSLNFVLKQVKVDSKQTFTDPSDVYKCLLDDIFYVSRVSQIPPNLRWIIEER